MSSGPSYETYQATRTFGSLDGLRCLSILAVIWHHARVFGVDGWVPSHHNGFLGVDLFFVISGFLIPTLLLRERRRHGAISLRQFYARRSLRIFPVYYGVLAAVSLALLAAGPGADMYAPFFAELPFYLTYTANWVPAHTMLAISWSLAAEEQFYLLWPPIERFARRVALPLLGAFLVVNQLVNFRLLDGPLAALGLHYAELPMLQATFTPICLGVAVAHLLDSPKGFAFAARWLGGRWAPVAAGVALLALVNVPGPLGGWPRLAIQLAMAAFVASCVAREDHALQPALRWRPVMRIGAISYGMYLFHLIALHPVALLLRRTGGDDSSALRFVLCTALTIVVAELSFRLYERPFLRWKERFSRRAPPR